MLSYIERLCSVEEFSFSSFFPPPPPPPPPSSTGEKLPKNAAGTFVRVFLRMVVVDIVVLLTIVEKLRRDLRNLSWWDKLPAGTELLISIFSQFHQDSDCSFFNVFFSSV